MIDPDEADIQINSFGAFRLTCAGRTVERWRAGKAKSLLQYLLLRRGRVVARDNLYEALWPDAPWSTNSSSLKVAVHMLRQTLSWAQDRRAEATRQSRLQLLTRESGYVLEAENVWLDFEAFDQLVELGHAAQLEHRDATEPYRRAVELYHGDFLADADTDWAATHREWLRSRLLCALSFLTDRAMAAGDHLSVLRWCQRTLEIEPFHEQSYRALILVHGQQGQLTQVYRWHQLCASRLREGLQVNPHLTTQRLYARAVRGDFVGRRLHAQAWRLDGQQPAFAG
ncbi:BTAD domain-containing putative transcriptional regulator [Micromonospora sp. NPDC048868]|uniref:AfsR/SARP family transcriptional regulator n=1 Tax=Micromonospora sp. NPDC048868 TaxID=3364258 RepID=UPI003721210E